MVLLPGTVSIGLFAFLSKTSLVTETDLSRCVPTCQANPIDIWFMFNYYFFCVYSHVDVVHRGIGKYLRLE